MVISFIDLGRGRVKKKNIELHKNYLKDWSHPCQYKRKIDLGENKNTFLGARSSRDVVYRGKKRRYGRKNKYPN